MWKLKNHSVEPLSRGFEPLCLYSALSFGTLVSVECLCGTSGTWILMWNSCGTWNLHGTSEVWNLGAWTLCASFVDTGTFEPWGTWTFKTGTFMWNFGNLVPGFARLPKPPRNFIGRTPSFSSFFLTSEMQSDHRPTDYTSAAHTEEIRDLMWNVTSIDMRNLDVRSQASFTGAGQRGTRMGFPTRPKVCKTSKKGEGRSDCPNCPWRTVGFVTTCSKKVEN